MKDVLVYARDIAPQPPSADYGVRLAARVGAAVTAAFVYPSPVYAAPSYGSPSLLTAIFENARATEESARALADPFIEWARTLGVRHAAWLVVEGYLPEVLARMGTWQDLLVLDRAPDAAWGSPGELAALVLTAGLPCVLVPPVEAERVAIDRIVVGWNASPEAIRAVHAAIPLLQLATHVVLLRGQPRAETPEFRLRPPFDIDAYLQRHGIEATHEELVTTDELAGEALLAAAARLGADLLVMGAYGRSRFSEWALGGATRHVLANASLPVFMRH